MPQTDKVKLMFSPKVTANLLACSRNVSLMGVPTKNMDSETREILFCGSGAVSRKFSFFLVPAHPRRNV